MIGVISPDGPKLNPPPETPIAGCTLIVVAEDDSTLRGEPDALVRPDLSRLGTSFGFDDHPTRAVLIGWNERAPIVLRELDKYAPPGSALTVVTSYDPGAAAADGEPGRPRGRRLDHRPGDARAARAPPTSTR